MRRGVSDSVLITAIVAAFLTVAAIGGPVAYNLTRPTGGAVVVPVPSVSPLSTFHGKPFAAEVGKAHRDFAAVLAKHPLQSTGTLKAKLVEFHVLLWSDKAGTLPGFSAAFEQQWAGAFGTEDGTLSPDKAQAFLTGVADALGG